MKFLIVLSVLAVSVFAVDDLKTEFALFKEKYNKSYSSLEEENHKFENYVKNKIEVLEHSLFYEQGKVKYGKGINQFSDLSFDEFAAIYLTGFKVENAVPVDRVFHYNPAIEAPDSVDWRESGYVTAVKNQAKCGACWAFSTTGALEGAYKKKTGNLVSWSEQELLDCDSSDTGCNGGDPATALEYIKSNQIATEEAYPYKGLRASCSKPSGGERTGISEIVGVPQGDEDALKQAVAEHGPISVTIAATNTFQLYTGQGVLHDDKCDQEPSNHAVLIVGYGSEGGEDFWLVKNSWGDGWGDGGYIKMARNKSSKCHIADHAYVPVV